MRPRPPPPRFGVRKPQAEFIGADLHILETGGLEHLAERRRRGQARWNLSGVNSQAGEQVVMPGPARVALPPPPRRHPQAQGSTGDRKSTRLNSSHVEI